MHDLLGERLPECAKLMSLEMGKPLGQAEAEVHKCQSIIKYYAKVASDFLEEEQLDTFHHAAYINHDPVGPVLDIVPWNFPFWMPFKSAIPPLVFGNPILLKPAPSTPQCALAIEQIFHDAGMDQGQWNTLFIDNQ